jgi:putative transposase
MKTYQLSDESWTRLAAVLPKYQPSPKGGRPRLDLKKVFEGILFIKGNRLTWRELPQEYGSKTSLNDYFRFWAKEGIFQLLQELELLSMPELISFEFDWEEIKNIYLSQ